MPDKIITIFCAFTREWAVERWLSDLSKLNHNPALTNLAFIVDIDDPRILRQLQNFAKERGYRSFTHKMNTEWSPNEVRIAVRRLRIADIKNQSKALIAQSDGEIIVSFEDDTVFDKLDLRRLTQPLLQDQIGFVEGVQCGRWGVKMVGAWEVDDFEYPQMAQTLFPGEGYQEIDGGGWYGYATTRGLYLNCDYYSASTQPWGPDVNFGLWLRNRGYKCIVDWESIFGHNDHNRVLYPDTDITQIRYTRDTNTGRWERTDVEQSS